MRTVVELTEKDIAQTIANAFDVDVGMVTLTIKEKWEGYAQNEHKVHFATAKVTLKGEDNVKNA